MTTDEYLRIVEQLVRENFKPNNIDGSMTAARVGYLARVTSGTEPVMAGFAKFKDALIELERRGVIRVVTNSKGALAIRFPEPALTTVRPESAAVAWPPPPAAGATPIVQAHRFKKLRNRLWVAFVVSTIPGKRFFDRATGEVRWVLDLTLEPAPTWVEIPRVDPAADKEDALAFLRSENREGDVVLNRSLESPTWFRDFPAALKVADLSLAARWNRRRSTRIIAEVERWAAANRVPSDLLFEPPSLIPAQSGQHPSATSQATIRQLVLAAVARLTTDELLQLRIPVRDVIAVVRPDLATG